MRVTRFPQRQSVALSSLHTRAESPWKESEGRYTLRRPMTGQRLTLGGGWRGWALTVTPSVTRSNEANNCYLRRLGVTLSLRESSGCGWSWLHSPAPANHRPPFQPADWDRVLHHPHPLNPTNPTNTSQRHSSLSIIAKLSNLTSLSSVSLMCQYFPYFFTFHNPLVSLYSPVWDIGQYQRTEIYIGRPGH